MKKLLWFIPILITITISCNKNDDKNTLTANIGNDIVASPGDTIWLDASASTGELYSEEWTVSGPLGDVTKLFDETFQMYYFIAENTGSYYITLRITSGSIFNEAIKTVTVSGAIKLGGTISETLTLKDVSQTQDSVDYILTEDLVIPKDYSLTIEDYVIIQIPEGLSITVEDGGYLYSANDIFTSSTSWKGIHIKGKAIFYNTKFENGGSSSFTSDATQKADVLVDETGKAGFTSCTFASSGGYGLYYTAGGRVYSGEINTNNYSKQVTSFSYNIFKNNTNGPLHGNYDLFEHISSNVFTDETSGTYIELVGGTISNAVNIANMGLSYKISGVFEFNSGVNINPGVTIEFEADAGIKSTYGTIYCGSESNLNEVILKGAIDGAGYWMGVYAGVSVEIYNTTIKGAGSVAIDAGQTQKAALYVFNQQLILKNSIIEDNDGIGVFVSDLAWVKYFENNSLANNKEGAVYVGTSSVGIVTASSNTYTPFSSASPTVTVRAGIDNIDWGTWADLPGFYDYLVKNDIILPITRSLIIEAGAMIKFASNTQFSVEGTLTALGTLIDPIYFTGEQNTNGYWNGMIFYNTTPKVLDFVHIEYGGGNGNPTTANLDIHSSAVDVTITNSFIINSAAWGVVANNVKDFILI